MLNIRNTWKILNLQFYRNGIEIGFVSIYSLASQFLLILIPLAFVLFDSFFGLWRRKFLLQAFPLGFFLST